jgi:uncharacterized protein
MEVTQEQLNEMVRRIVEAAHPLQIIMFGSTARGEAEQWSDVDVLVIVSDGTHRLDTAENIYRKLHGLRVDVDLIVATEGDIARYKDSPGLVYRDAIRDGRMLYAA